MKYIKLFENWISYTTSYFVSSERERINKEWLRTLQSGK